ncbi:CX3C chemokine receptor 1-like [Gigantopelta aegis]|uniref:CX3C chemokine receptor 1-like n=1 Tax=Gigantopelta aegis TaxID=1735272 RepID=UPI001B88DE03|nr:CX3C chemokine receptor 1-like [Gigantopelta aegis]
MTSNSTEQRVIHVTGLTVLLQILEHHVPLSLGINKSVTPIWYVFGVIGNVTSAFIWLNKRLRKCNNAAFYLASLAVTDLIFLILHLFYELQNPWLLGSLNVQGWCQIWNMLYMAAGYTCVLLVFAFTFERFLSICHPFRSERFSTSSRSLRVIASIVCLCLVLATPQLYFWTMTSKGECQVRMSELIKMENSFYSIWTWGSEMIMFGVIPLIVLFLNICVLRKVRYIGQLKMSDSCTNGNLRYKPITITLLWVSFFLIFTTLPVTITFTLQTKITLGPALTMQEIGHDPAWQAYFSYYMARTIIKEIGLSHHACNMIIYCLTSQKFRAHICRLLLGPGVTCGQNSSSNSDQKEQEFNSGRHITLTPMPIVKNGSRAVLLAKDLK